MVLRLVKPFEQGEIDQLLVQVRKGDEPSKGVSRVEPVVAPPVEPVVATPVPAPPWGKIALVAAAVIAIIAAVMSL